MARATCPSLKIWATSLPQKPFPAHRPGCHRPGHAPDGRPVLHRDRARVPGAGRRITWIRRRSLTAWSQERIGDLGVEPRTYYHQPKQPPGRSGNGQGAVLSYAVAWCGAVVPCRPGCRSRPCALLLGGDDVPVSRVGKDEPPRPRRLGPHAAARSQAAVPRAAVRRAAGRRAAVPPVAARARHRPVPVGGPGWWRSR